MSKPAYALRYVPQPKKPRHTPDSHQKKAHLCSGLHRVAKMCWRISNVTEKKANRAKATQKSSGS